MRYAERSAPPPGGDALEFVLSDNSVDRVGDVIEQNWSLANFRNNPIALFNHDRDHVIGTWEKVRVDGTRLIGRLQLAKEDPRTPVVNAVRALVEQKILRATSVGFIPIEQEPLNDKSDDYWGPWRFTKSELLEASLVSVPANPNAIALARSLNLEPDLIGAIFSKPANEARAAQPASLPKATVEIRRTQTMQLNQTLASRIGEAQKNITALQNRLNDITSKDESEQNEEEARRADELPDEIDAAETLLQKLLRQERAISGARRAGSIATQAASGTEIEVVKQARQEIIRPGEMSQAELRRPFGGQQQKVQPGDYVLRSLVTLFAAHCGREQIDHVLRSRYGDRDENMNTVLRAAVNPSMTTTAGNAAELVQTQNAAFMDRILPSSIYLPIANRGVRYTFPSGVTQLKIPVRTATSKVAGAWVGEGAPKPVKPPSFTSVPLVPHKLAVISTFTEEMALYSNPAIESILRQALEDDTRESLDTYLIDNVASSSTRPAGLLNGVTPLTATASGTTTEKMVADLKQLVAAIVAAGGGREIVALINPAQAISLGFAMTTTGDFLFATVAEAGTKFNITFIVSQTVAAGRVIAVEASEFATATGDTPRFAVSNEATLHEEDTTPLPIGSAGTPNVVAAPVRSLFQTDSVAIRLSWYVSWVMRRPSMVQTIASVGW